jgi:ABC-type nitrate/sulfonate/bicarbonate transport system substrate-binding protein
VKRRAFLAAAGAALLTACGTASGSATKPLRYQGGAGSVTLPELAADLGFLGDVKLDWVGNTISGPQDIQSAATGQTDFGGAFNGAVVKLAAAGAPIKAVVGYYGSDQYAYNGFYVLEDSPIRSAADLAGKKVGMNTLGAHLEAMLDIYLQRNGVDPKKAEPLVVPPVNIEQSLRQKQIEVATLGGILRDKALQTGGIRKLFTDFELLGPFTAGTYVFTEKFIKQNPDTVRAFVTGVGRAIEWSRTTPSAQVVDRMTRIVQKRGRNEDGSALKYWKSWGVAEKGGRVAERDLSMWVDWLAGRGELANKKIDISSLYTNEFNGVPS